MQLQILRMRQEVIFFYINKVKETAPPLPPTQEEVSSGCTPQDKQPPRPKQNILSAFNSSTEAAHHSVVGDGHHAWTDLAGVPEDLDEDGWY